MKTQGFIRLIQSADTHASSVMELNILPGEKTPWHYHTLFSETFEILKGTLEVGVGKEYSPVKTGRYCDDKAQRKTLLPQYFSGGMHHKSYP
jgi:quercetin dioxygenase-like cupin family protein